MNVIGDLASKLTTIVNNPDKLIESTVERHLDEIEDIQREQMSLGLNAVGEPIGILRSLPYAFEKKRRGGKAPLGVVDLKNRGSFQKGVNARIANKAVHLTSSDSKTQELEDKYNRNGAIFGLNTKSKEELKPVLIPTAIFEILRTIK